MACGGQPLKIIFNEAGSERDSPCAVATGPDRNDLPVPIQSGDPLISPVSKSKPLQFFFKHCNSLLKLIQLAKY